MRSEVETVEIGVVSGPEVATFCHVLPRSPRFPRFERSGKSCDVGCHMSDPIDWDLDGVPWDP